MSSPIEEVQPKHSNAQWEDLCKKTQDLVPDEVGVDAWYLIIASALITSPSPELLGEFSTFLTSQHTAFQTEESRSKLSLRLRDVCIKLMSLVGAPTMLCALMPLAKSEGDVEAKAEKSVLSEKWKSVDAAQIHARGSETIYSIYDHHFLPKIFSSWGAHKEDIIYTEIFGVYGLYLSDFEVLDPIETKAIVFTSISCQGYKGPGLWHLRGMGRVLGARGPDVGGAGANAKLDRVKDLLRDVKRAVLGVVDFVGDEFVKKAKVEEWANVGDVQRVIGGWGDD